MLSKVKKVVVPGIGTGVIVEEICEMLLVDFEFTKQGPCIAWVDTRREEVLYA